MIEHTRGEEQAALRRYQRFGGQVSLFCRLPSVCLFLSHSLTFSLSPPHGCLFSQREALLSALHNGERWQDVVTLVEAMLAKLLVVDNPTAGLAMKAYANLGLKEHWRSVGFRCGGLCRGYPARICGCFGRGSSSSSLCSVQGMQVGDPTECKSRANAELVHMHDKTTPRLRHLFWAILLTKTAVPPYLTQLST